MTHLFHRIVQSAGGACPVRTGGGLCGTIEGGRLRGHPLPLGKCGAGGQRGAQGGHHRLASAADRGAERFMPVQQDVERHPALAGDDKLRQHVAQAFLHRSAGAGAQQVGAGWIVHRDLACGSLDRLFGQAQELAGFLQPVVGGDQPFAVAA